MVDDSISISTMVWFHYFLARIQGGGEQTEDFKIIRSRGQSMNHSIVSACNVCKTYHLQDQEISVLQDVNLSLEQGEFVALCGKSGVGKSTLLHILGGLDRATSGQVCLQGTPYGEEAGLPPREREIDKAKLRNTKIGFVFQFHHLLPEFSALENVMMPALIGRIDRSVAERKAMDLLTQFELRHRMNHRPGELSGGEQQRVALARALINDPILILADEPTGNLDEATSKTIHEIMRDLNKARKLTILIATHNSTLASQCDRVLELHDGKLRSSGVDC